MTAYAQPLSGSIPHTQYVRNVPSQVIRSEIGQFAAKSNDLANQILIQNSPQRYEGPVIIRNHYYYDGFYSPWYHPSVIILGGDRGHGRRDRNHDDGASILLGIVATIGALFATYAVGSAIASHSDAKRELDETRDVHQKLLSYHTGANSADQQLLDEALCAATLKERICSRIRNSSAVDLALRVALTAGLVLTAVGAFTACPPVLAVGLALSLSTAGAMLLKWGVESKDKANVRDAQFLKNCVANLRQL